MHVVSTWAIKIRCTVFQFKIQIEGIAKPPVWRRLTVPGGFTFTKFHHVIQAAFAWEDAHLFQFSPAGRGSSPVINIPGPEFGFMDDGLKKRHTTKTKLSALFPMVGQTFLYTYDFGDDWQHRIALEKIIDTETKTAGCLAGRGAAPPEDCGGP